MAIESSANSEEAADRLESLVVVREPVASFVIDRYWLLILISALAYVAFERTVGPPSHPLLGHLEQLAIDLSFYPMLLLVGGLVKSLLRRKIPGAFARLYDTGALKAKAAAGLTGRFEKRLNHFLATASGVTLGLVFFGFYHFGAGLLATTERGRVTAAIVIITIDVLLAYAGGVAIWKVAATVWEFHQLGRRNELMVRPFHPDSCGGLAAVGHLFFSLSFILIVLGFFFGGWLLYSRWINPEFGAIEGYAPWFVGGLVGIAVLSVAVFFLPLLDVHHLMEQEAKRHERRLLVWARQIADLEGSLLSSGALPSHEDLDARLAQIERLRKIYLAQKNAPTWPVDFQTRWKFVSAQTALWISLPTSAFDLWEKWEKVIQ